MLELFNTPIEPINVLPFDGDATYFGKILDQDLADHYLQKLLSNIRWKNDEVMLFGKKITTKRMIAWFGDKEYAYTYSKVTKNALIWTSELLELKKIIEKYSGESYNSCLLNLYHDGNEGLAYHSDNEKNLKKNGAIASVSFGAARKFSFKHKNSGEKVDILLEHGSLLLMKGETQEQWFHRLPPTKKVDQPRVNLTFRTFIE